MFTLLILLISAWSQEEAAAPARKSNLLSRRPVGGRALGKSASATTSTTTTAPPADEENYDGAEENAEDYDAAAADENGKYIKIQTKWNNTQHDKFARCIQIANCIYIYIYFHQFNAWSLFWQAPMNQL